MGFWYLAQNISANVFWCFWQLFALEICGLDARMSTGCHSKITEPQNRTHASCKGQGSGQSEAQKSAKYEIRSTQEGEIRNTKHTRAGNTMVCSRRLAPAHLQAWQVEILSFGCNPDLARGPPWSHHSFGERFYLEKSQMAHGKPHFS